MKVEALDIGCSVRGIRAEQMTLRELEQIRDLLYRKRLVVLKDQSLDETAYCAFAHRFGTPVPYLQDNYHHPDFPLIFVSSNVKRDGKQIGVARTGGYWHSDTSFEKDPKPITMLMPKIMPRHHARSTRFIDMCDVFHALSPEQSARLRGAALVHSGRWRYKVTPEALGYDIFEILEQIDRVSPPVRHPALIVHPYTGETGLYANRGFTLGIADASLDESAAVLGALFDFAEQPRFVKEVRWSIGDVIIWDNRFLVHSSGRNGGAEEETMMFRITLKDEFPLCASRIGAVERAAA